MYKNVCIKYMRSSIKNYNISKVFNIRQSFVWKNIYALWQIIISERIILYLLANLFISTYVYIQRYATRILVFKQFWNYSH